MKKFSLIVIAVLVASLGIAGGVAAKPGKGHHKAKAFAAKAKAVHGIVDAVGTDSITLKNKNGFTLTIAVTADTQVRVNGAPAALADVEVGYHAIVFRNEDGSAKAILAKDPAFKKEVHGIVDSVGTDSITLKHKNGSTLTIPVTSETKIRVNGAPGQLSDIHPGFRAEVRLNADGSAKAINAKDPEFKPVVHGVIEAVGSDSITLKLRKDGSLLEIPVTSETKIHLKCSGEGTLADLQVGFRAYVKRNADGSARRIQAVQPHFRCVVKGSVTAVGSDSLTLQLKDGSSLTVGVNSDTKIIVNGAPGSLSDIQVGYEAYVKRTDDNTARRINAHAPDSD